MLFIYICFPEPEVFTCFCSYLHLFLFSFFFGWLSFFLFLLQITMISYLLMEHLLLIYALYVHLLGILARLDYIYFPFIICLVYTFLSLSLIKKKNTSESFNHLNGSNFLWMPAYRKYQTCIHSSGKKWLLQGTKSPRNYILDVVYLFPMRLAQVRRMWYLVCFCLLKKYVGMIQLVV